MYVTRAVHANVGLGLICAHLLQAVYQIPTEDDVPRESFVLALQRVFYHLQTANLPAGRLLTQRLIDTLLTNNLVDTIELTRSFGWGPQDSLTQHDVHEFNRVLQDKLEVKMKGSVRRCCHEAFCR